MRIALECTRNAHTADPVKFFQVNTAARMESNGTPGRIHCSFATADLLKEAGKEHWLTPREDVVHAKGKGAMQTYWVKPVKAAGCGLGDSMDELVIEQDSESDDCA